MARIARKILDANLFHLMTKGVNHEKIFSSPKYKKQILDLYFHKDYPWSIYAYAIMDNHTHFLVDVNDISILSEIMKSINIKYSMYYNFINDRNGHLFQNRFKSVPIKNERHLFETLRYIHNNPIIAGLSKSLQDSEFTSFKCFFLNDNKYLVSSDFIHYTRENFKNNNEFERFHKEKFYSIQMDTKEDRQAAQNQIINSVLDQITNRDSKIACAKKLINCGISKTIISEKLKISRNRF